MHLADRSSAHQPGAPQRPDAAPDQQAGAGLAAGRVLVEELQRLEAAVGEEAVGAGQELRTGSHLAAAITTTQALTRVTPFGHFCPFSVIASCTNFGKAAHKKKDE